MRTSRRKLEPDADGKASVMLLTDPIPRHVSIVSWGANDAPAASWKSASPTDEMMANHTLRSPPSGVIIDSERVTGSDLRAFLDETLSAWVAAMKSVLATPLESADRASRMRGLTVQAGARVAAAATALGKAATRAAKSNNVIGLALPELPTASTLQGEIDRRHFVASLENASAALIDLSIKTMNAGDSVTESILSIFAQAADAFSMWAASMPRGVVGVQQASSESTKSTTSPPEYQMITIEDLERLASEHPKRFLQTIKSAVEKAEMAPAVAKKFMWGETGEQSFDVAQILSGLRQQGGAGLESLIMAAVGGINLDTVAADNTQVAAAFKSTIGKAVVDQMKSDPKFLESVLAQLAPAVSETVVETVRAYADHGGTDLSMSAFDDEGDDDADQLMGELPGR